jgi:hypothetical protein
MPGASLHPSNGTFCMNQDIIVLGWLAGLFCWTYIILPLVFYS